MALTYSKIAAAFPLHQLIQHYKTRICDANVRNCIIAHGGGAGGGGGGGGGSGEDTSNGMSADAVAVKKSAHVR